MSEMERQNAPESGAAPLTPDEVLQELEWLIGNEHRRGSLGDDVLARQERVAQSIERQATSQALELRKREEIGTRLSELLEAMDEDERGSLTYARLRVALQQLDDSR